MFYGHNRKICHRRAPKTFGGVGTLVSKNVYNWYDVSVIDNCVDGIQAVQFIDKASHYSFIVYNCYLPPVNSVYGQTSVDFFNHLTQQLYSNYEADLIVICGDFNARIGNQNDVIIDIDDLPLRCNIDDCVQGHNEDFLNFVKDSKLCILNGRFGEESNKFTCVSDKGRLVADYMVVPHDCSQKLREFKVMPMTELPEKFELVGLTSSNSKPSDHSVLYAKIDMCINLNDQHVESFELPIMEKPCNFDEYNKRKYYFNEVPEDFMLNEQFLTSFIDVVTRQLSNCTGQEDLDKMYDNVCQLITGEMDRCLRFSDKANKARKKGKQRKPYWNHKLSLLWKDMILAEKEFLNCKGHHTQRNYLRNIYVTKRKLFDKCLRKCERKYNEKVVNDIEEVCLNDPRNFWNHIKSLGPRNKTEIPLMVYDEKGDVNSDLAVVLDKWRNEFSDLLNRPDVDLFDDNFFHECLLEKEIMENNPIDCDSHINSEVSAIELGKVLKKLRCKKSTGVDVIPNEVLKRESIATQLHYLFNKLIVKELVPSAWCKAIISPIPKCNTKDPKVPLNYRGISLLSCMGKLYSSIINSRISQFCEGNTLFSDEQNGFRPKRSCEDHIFVLSSVLRNRMSDNEQTFCAFVDMQKAFDWVDRDILFYILLKYGIRGKIYKCIKLLYANPKACVKVNNFVTEWFDITSGVRQGDPLSPTLFCILINELIEEVKQLQLGVFVKDRRLSILAFADDIVLIGRDESELAILLRQVEMWCRKYRLMVNTEKTKIVHFRRKRKDRSCHVFKFNDQNLEYVSNYKYLGVTMHEHMEFKVNAEILAGSAGRALGGVLSKFKTLKNVGFRTFEKMYYTSVVPIMDYSCGVWGYNCHQELEKIQQRAIRYYLGVHSKAALLALEGDICWKNCKIRQNVNMIRLWNKLLLMDESRLTRNVFDWDYENQKGWCLQVKELFISIGLLDVYLEKRNCDLRLVESRLFETRQNQWKEMLITNPKLRTYRLFKNVINTENYVYIKNRKKRSLLAQLRLGILPLNIEMGRFRNIPVEERICELCDCGMVEDEKHFLCICTLYEEYRDDMYCAIENENFPTMSVDAKFNYLMENECNKVSSFLCQAWEKRKQIIYNSEQLNVT